MKNLHARKTFLKTADSICRLLLRPGQATFVSGYSTYGFPESGYPKRDSLSIDDGCCQDWFQDRRVIYESLAKSKGIHVEFVSDGEKYITAIDVLKMEKILDNLISNAVKYSHNGGKVIIEFKADKSRWTLTVKDNGIGISKKAQRKLFREFYRGENAMNAKIVGSGIGLLLVKNYVTFHGGIISFESQMLDLLFRL
ncbi:MAG: HAMP domain-containing sensor histidine kinase [Dermatophilaceae bacterium]